MIKHPAHLHSNPPNDALVAIAMSFKGIAQPETLLHPQCFDDNDIKLFERTTHWEIGYWRDK